MKLKNKEKRLCGGKLVITDFKRLNPKNLLLVQNYTPEQLNEELAVCTAEGKIYINSRMEGNKMVSGIFENFITQSRKTLEEFQKVYDKKFPHIRNFDDWAAWSATEENNEQRVFALAVLMVPLELKRRSIESAYYGKIRTFPN